MESNINILIVDDDNAIANFLSKMLLSAEDLDCDVTITHSAEDGTHLIEESKFDIIILDINLPGKSGIEFLMDINSIDPDIESIIMTGDASLETALDALREGAYDYLQKPFTKEQVITTIRNATQKRQLTMEKRELLKNLNDVNEQLEKANQMLTEKKILLDTELEKKVEDLTNINLFVKGITPQLDLIKLFTTIPRFIIDLFGFKGAAIVTFSRHNFVVHTAMNTGDDFKKGEVYSKDSALINELIKPLIIKDIGQISKNGLFYVSTPLKAGKKLLGILLIGDERNNLLEYYGEELFSTIAGNTTLAIQNALFFDNSKKSYLESLFSFLIILETEDPELREHSERVSNIATKIAKQLELDDDIVTNIRYAGLLHDIGKVGAIKNTPGDSIVDKIKKVHKNTEKIIKPISFLAKGLEYLHFMYENFDGSGFPEGKSGDAIPIGARILAISNAYDEIYLQLISAGKGDNIHNKILIELNKHVGINLDPRIFAILQGITF